jgi:putative NADH-flavin reductase
MKMISKEENMGPEEFLKVVVFGATGGTGHQVVCQALAQGHTVTAFVRDPARVTVPDDDRLRVVVGDVLDRQAVDGAVDGQDAVVIALGTRDRSDRTIRTEGTANVVRAMQSHGIRRVVAVSAGGVGDSYDQVPLLIKVLIKTLLRNTYADHEAQEQVLRDSELDWVIVRPSMLTDGPHTGEYRTGTAEDDLPGGQVSRADVADFVLRQLPADNYLRHAVTIT